MSAETIAALNSAADAYHGKIQQIDAKLDAALAAAPSMGRSYFVHRTSGDDSAVGNAAAPLASIREAIERTPRYGGVTIYLQADYSWDYRVNSLDRQIEVRSDSLPNRRQINFGAFEQGSNVYLGGVTMVGANCWLHLYGLNLRFPQYTGGYAENPQYSNIVGTHTAQTKSLQHVGLTDCDLNMPATNGIGAICSRTAGSVVFNAQNITDVNSNMSGRYIRGASGATPEQYASIVTNMTSL